MVFGWVLVNWFLFVILILCLVSAKATEEYEAARLKVANFINASECREIVFTRNATEAINLVAYSWGLSNLKKGDEVRALVFRNFIAKKFTLQFFIL